MGALGVLFLFVVLGQTVAEDGRVLAVLSVVGWLLWSVFVAEFALRAYTATDRRRFWRRNWWQVVFLAVPFLRFLRVLSVLRVARVSSVLSAAVRGSRSAGRLLSGRVAWLSVVTAVVVLASSQLLHLTGGYDSYGEALNDAAMSTITGAPLELETGLARVLEVVLAMYSVAVFATLAAALGAYFLQPRPAGPVPDSAAAQAQVRLPVPPPAGRGSPPGSQAG